MGERPRFVEGIPTRKWISEPTSKTLEYVGLLRKIPVGRTVLFANPEMNHFERDAWVRKHRGYFFTAIKKVRLKDPEAQFLVRSRKQELYVQRLAGEDAPVPWADMPEGDDRAD